ncbi:acyltransferase family protein [Stutzerimonas nitrititolerans]|uniref:acyltransferase family protein n=1 Tax=Stutzerimonas nitrititolerans TaxID=2482751 RepID=UPI00289BA5F5|nr:acyltransferase family protein [Stutzerimonas nitrititolerans]
MDNRINWIDSLKFIGIFYIYLGHLGGSAGNLYPFVFSFHVPLFFFISGCFASTRIRSSFGQFVMEKFKQLMIPYFVYSLLSIVVYLLCIPETDSFRVVASLVLKALLGVRNDTPYGPSLWFLPCIFVTALIFRAACIITTGRLGLACVFIGLYLASLFAMGAPPAQAPRMWLNADSALYYGLFYFLGWLTFGWIKQLDLLLHLRNLRGLILFGGTGVVVIVTFLKGINYPYAALGLDLANPARHIFNLPLILALIVFHFFAAYALAGLQYATALGKETLTLCGLETITRTVLISLITTAGLTLSINNAFSAIIFTLVTLSFSLYVVIPVKDSIVKYYTRERGDMPAKVTEPRLAEAPAEKNRLLQERKIKP